MSLPERFDVMSAKESKGQTFWNRVGVAFLNKAGNGYNVMLDAMPAPTDGAFRFSLFQPKENNNSSGGSGGGKRPAANIPDEDDSIPF